jgi:YD repeat-containing protein
MPTLTCGNGAFTPATNQDNWTLDSQTSGVFGKVVAIGWGGRMTTSTGYRTRWTRPTTGGSSTFTALTNAYHQPNYTSFGARIGTFATAPTLASDPAGNLWAQDWNAQGGVGAIVMPLANPWWIVNGILQGQISCRNIAGTDANGSSYEVTYEE